MRKPIRVLIVDDSPLFAEAMLSVLRDDPGFAVVDVCDDGAAAVQKTANLRPDLITMDLHMPVMGGIEAIERIMAQAPTPILVLTADPAGHDGALALEALRCGAVDVMLKPSSWPIGKDAAASLRRQISLIATVPAVYRSTRPVRPSLAHPAAAVSRGKPKLVAMVASTGGPAALASILSSMPADYPAGIVVVQHLAKGFAATLASWLAACCAMRVCLAQDGAAIAPGTVHIAPDGVHTVVNHANKLALERGHALDGHVPSGTRLLQSVAQVYGAEAIGVLLTGMGDDGAAGLLAMKRRRAVTVVQDEASSVVWGMPRAAAAMGAACHVVALHQMAKVLCDLATCHRSVMSTSGGST